MENIFGKQLAEYKKAENLRNVFSAEKFNQLCKDAQNIKKGAQECVERIAELVIDNIKTQDHFNYHMQILNSYPELYEVLIMDLKFYMISAFYYKQLIDKPKIVTDSSFTNAFDERTFFYRSRRQQFCKKRQTLPLKGFFPKGQKPKIYSNIIDLGLVQSLLASIKDSKNPYVKEKDYKNLYVPATDVPDFNPYGFLNLFSTAYIKKEHVETLLEKLPNFIGKKAEAEDTHRNQFPSDTKMIDDVNKMSVITSPEALAVINQFCIERLTNMNFIISFYNYKTNLENQATTPFNTDNIFDNWLIVPLFKTRLKVLEMQKYGIFQYDNQTQIQIIQQIPIMLLKFYLPLFSGTFSYLMDYTKTSITKDEPYFKKVYVDPDPTSIVEEPAYRLFTLITSNNTKELCPIVKFSITNDIQLSKILSKNTVNQELKRKININIPFEKNKTKLLKMCTFNETNVQYIVERYEQLYTSLTKKVQEYEDIICTNKQFNQTEKKKLPALLNEIKSHAKNYSNYNNNSKTIKQLSSAHKATVDMFEKFNVHFIPGPQLSEKLFIHSNSSELINIFNEYKIPYITNLYSNQLRFEFFKPNYSFDLKTFNNPHDSFYKKIIPDFALFSYNIAVRFEILTNNIFEEQNYYSPISIYNVFDNALAKLSTLRAKSLQRPDIVTAIENLYMHFNNN